ncbi:unnamed protein product [Acanthoscelides obtectus]|uniref:Uncharacterized protein n=1 Tax=Acanthoscelides obtectus TaxID=200917 RepID=A0A9P0NVI4_ACAOB|nr:unnamed protein product [Acanthoscelides obtectus]CAK1639887.1 hypothetical protein AOBTE_LOCUS11432 [Acanthoscelides obtectus]
MEYSLKYVIPSKSLFKRPFFNCMILFKYSVRWQST